MQNNNYVWYRESQKKKPNYLLIVLGAIFMVLCITMLGIVLSAIWFIEYGV